MKCSILLLTLWLLLPNFVYSQTLPLPVSIPSPNAAGLGKFGDVPVSYFTGTPNISVPLYNLEVKGIKVPVCLQYNASGIRIDDHPGWVGQNWSLETGGVITRTVRGNVDELNIDGTGLATPYGTSRGYYYTCTDLDLSVTGTPDELKSHISRNYYDFEPDIFTFNFLGKTGKFFMDNNREWKVLSDENLKIVCDITTDVITPLGNSAYVGNQPFSDKMPGHVAYEGEYFYYPKVIGGFTIIDGDGTKYVFGKQPDAIEYSIDLFHQTLQELWKANAWYLTEIIDKYGNDVFDFTYERDDYIAHIYRSIGASSNLFSGYGFLSNSYSCSASIDVNAVGGELISPVYLSTITSAFNNLNLTFTHTETDELKYSAISIFDKVQHFIDYYRSSETSDNLFYYLVNINRVPDPFYETVANDVINALKWQKLTSISGANQYVSFTYNNNPSERLNLLQVDIYGKDNTTQAQTYKFDYNNFSSLPGYLSNCQDHWGFYKGTPFTINPSNLDSYYDTRQSNSDFLKIGMLDNIIYPTGGSSTFEYEANDYNQIVNDNKTGLLSESGIAGGVRIKSISDYDGVKNETRDFKYVLYYGNPGSSTSSGILSYKPKYYWHNNQYIGSGSYSTDIFSINNIIPMGNMLGSHIGYSEVAEIRTDGSYTLYKYSNYGMTYFDDNGPIATLNINPGPYDRISDLSLLRGKLLSETKYDNKNNPVQKRELTYRSDVSSQVESNYIIGTNALAIHPCGTDLADYIYTGCSYKLFYFDYDVITETLSNYFPSGTVKETTSYTKNDVIASKSNIRLTSAITKSGSDGLNTTTNLYYPSDLSDSYMSDLVDAFRVNEVISTQKTKNSKSIGATITTYKLETGLTAPVPATFQKSKTDASGLVTENFYDKYDNSSGNSKGNLLQYHTRDGVNTSLIWGYDGQYIVAKCENSTYTQIQPYATNIQDLSKASNCTNCPELSSLITSVNNLRTSLPSAIITSYSYIPQIGVTSITGPNNLTEYYMYDESNRLSDVLNNDSKYLKKYKYNYRTYPFLVGIISCLSEYNFGDPVNLNIKGLGGSGTYSFQWVISNGSSLVTFTGSSPAFNIQFYGNVNISCTVHDDVTGASNTVQKKIYVNEPYCYFSDINVDHGWGEGRIYSPFADVVNIYIESNSVNSADFYIGGTHYLLTSGQSKTIALSVGDQSYTYCSVSFIRQSDSEFADIVIMSLNNGTSSVGEPYLIRSLYH